MQPRRLSARLVGLVGFVLPAAASALQVDYLVELGIEHNDNVNLSEDDPRAENILEPMLGFNLRQDGSTIQAEANGVLQYRDYSGGEFSDELRGQLAGHLNWTAVPERLNLTIEDYAGVQPINQLQPNTPSNQQETNVFAIGPTLSCRYGPTVRGEAELRYIDSYAEETSEFNTNRVSGAVRAIKDLDPTSTLSANIDDERVEFKENDAGPDYSRYNAFGRYTRKWTDVDLTADLGYSWLRYSGGLVDDRDSPLGRATLAWRYGTHSTLAVDLAYQFSDAASFMMTGAAATAIPTEIATGDATTTSQAYLERRLGLTYAYADPRLTFTFAPYYRKLAYANVAIDSDPFATTGIDETGKGASASLAYLLRPLLSIGFVATGENLQYNDLDREDKTWSVTAFFRQQWTRNWSWRVELTHSRRDSNTPGQSYDQNIAYFALTYTRAPRE
jgi:hypothetical protein